MQELPEPENYFAVSLKNTCKSWVGGRPTQMRLMGGREGQGSQQILLENEKARVGWKPIVGMLVALRLGTGVCKSVVVPVSSLVRLQLQICQQIMGLIPGWNALEREKSQGMENTRVPIPE